MPRTASTFLQNEFFPNLINLNYINTKDELGKKLINCIKNPYFYNEFYLKQLFSSYSENISFNKILISNEALFGNLKLNLIDSITCYEKIKNIFGKKVKIILVIRKQSDYLESHFKHFIKQGFHQNINSFLNYKNSKFCSNRNINKFGINIDVRILDYNYICENLFRIFGKENCLVIPYELMKINIDFFLNQICSFIEINNFQKISNKKINRSLDEKEISIFNLINSLVYSNQNPNGLININFVNSINDKLGIEYKIKNNGINNILFNIFSKFHIFSSNKNKFTDQKKILIMNFFKDSNLQLDKKIKFNLKKWGYY